MNTTYAMFGSGSPVDVSEVERDDAEVVEVVVAWGHDRDETILSTRHLALGKSLRVGDDDHADVVLPSDTVAGSHVLFTSSAAGVRVDPPAGSALLVDGHASSATLVTRGHEARVAIGSVVLRLRIVAAGRKTKAPLLASLAASGLPLIALSGIFHASLIGAVAFFMPAMSADDADTIDRDQVLTMQKYLNASAEREADRQRALDGAQGAAEGAREPAPSGGARSAGNEGAMGGPKSSAKPGRWSQKGDARPEDATLAHDRARAEAAQFGMIGLLATLPAGDPQAPVAPWGTVANGSDKESHLGNFWSNDIGDAFGTGLGLSGDGEGGGGRGEGIGVNDVGGLGRSLDRRIGSGDPGGWGHGSCKGPNCPNGGHQARGPSMRLPPQIETNGRLPPELIQRIVRMNQGRFRACYESGLGHNPSLTGRVAVRFVIARSGAVNVAQDAGSDLPDETVRQCVVRSFYGLSFPEPQNGTVTVTYPIFFSPAS